MSPSTEAMGQAAVILSSHQVALAQLGQPRITGKVVRKKSLTVQLEEEKILEASLANFANLKLPQAPATRAPSQMPSSDVPRQFGRES
ncbi:hypothetical protein IE81DRAFT_350075 [Ceraceosorus guamensis]|uniref:Uncharacterized protein n=1 Tax=Ceraceosorus guamensis TaxID=1522189 RepID=A0A316VPT5_9BASI|nr:hypothetical protein IE81DRAFT_350075 [Ceraceosorus guamensis]PWN39532.1 hypothetical protein IE81DRAFT_350075 [Ceraceosorus guamensis]